MDRDFLFGVLAVQLGQATPAQVMAAASAYVADKSKSIPERLLSDGVFTEARLKMLSAMVDEALEAHGGDVKKTMHTLGGERVLYVSFGGAVARDEHGELSLVPEAVRKPAAKDESAEDFAAVTPEAPDRYRMAEGAEAT